jgi:nucleoside phosphorylase
MPAATALAMKMIDRFKPRVLGMVGIAAGIRAHFGDVLIADNVWDYGAGKRVAETGGKSAFLPAPDAIPLSPNLKSRFEVFGLEREILREIQSAWPGPSRTYAPLQSFIGPIASGASVLADRSTLDELVLRNRKLVGVEMEAYGVFTAARDCVDPRPQTFVMKSVCDFGDDEKNDDFQAYAAFTSARYLYEFAMSELTRVGS